MQKLLPHNSNKPKYMINHTWHDIKIYFKRSLEKHLWCSVCIQYGYNPTHMLNLVPNSYQSCTSGPALWSGKAILKMNDKQLPYGLDPNTLFGIMFLPCLTRIFQIRTQLHFSNFKLFVWFRKSLSHWDRKSNKNIFHVGPSASGVLMVVPNSLQNRSIINWWQ